MAEKEKRLASNIKDREEMKLKKIDKHQFIKNGDRKKG